MPRKTNDEIIADLKAKLAAAEARTDKSRQGKIAKLNTAIGVEQARIAKATAKIASLTEERDALIAEDVESDTATGVVFQSASADAVG